jgi:hypothetical protein
VRVASASHPDAYGLAEEKQPAPLSYPVGVFSSTTPLEPQFTRISQGGCTIAEERIRGFEPIWQFRAQS